MNLFKKIFIINLFSKIIILISFFIFLILGFLLINYQKFIFKTKEKSINLITLTIKERSCALEAKVCPDGSVVGRIPPDCNFAPCPSEKIEKNKQKICGGIAGIQCPEGYICNIEGKNYPDATGICIKKDQIDKVLKYQCPKTNYIDCQPKIGTIKSDCNPAYLDWVKKNCPDFQGIVY